MRPLNVLNLHADYKMDFVADCVLDMLSNYASKTTVNIFVQECFKNNVSSQATTYKKLGLLRGLGFAEEVENPEDPDKRKVFIRITSKGMEYLKRWER